MLAPWSSTSNATGCTTFMGGPASIRSGAKVTTASASDDGKRKPGADDDGDRTRFPAFRRPSPRRLG